MKSSLINKVNIVHTWIIFVLAAMLLLTLIGVTIAADADARLDHNCIDTPASECAFGYATSAPTVK